MSWLPSLIFSSAGSATYVSAGTAQGETAQNTARGTGTTAAPVGATLALTGGGCYLDARLNGRKITDIRYSAALKDDMVIRRFYHRDGGFEHGFVVFETNSGDVFLVHLRGGIHSNGEIEIFIEIKVTTWRPKEEIIQKSDAKVKYLKGHIGTIMTGFGHYQLGIRDCRHFSRDIARFLAI